MEYIVFGNERRGMFNKSEPLSCFAHAKEMVDDLLSSGQFEEVSINQKDSGGNVLQTWTYSLEGRK